MAKNSEARERISALEEIDARTHEMHRQVKEELDSLTCIRKENQDFVKEIEELKANAIAKEN